MALYIKELVGKERPESIIKFLELFLFTKKVEGTNKFIESFAKATYKNKACEGNSHCPRGRMRSFDDILELTKTYYPSITPKKLFHIILTTSWKSQYLTYDWLTERRKVTDIIIYPQYGNCGTMRRIRLVYGHGKHNAYNSICNIGKYGSKYSWKDLYLMLKINSQAELNAYIEKHQKLIN